MKGSLGTAVKLLPCDHEVMGSSPGISLLPGKCCVHKTQSGTLAWTLRKRELCASGCHLSGQLLHLYHKRQIAVFTVSHYVMDVQVYFTVYEQLKSFLSSNG
jgi:hypothetical protein